MIWLKDLNNMVRSYKDGDTKTVNALLKTGRWIRVNDKKDLTPYVEKKITKKKSAKSKSAEVKGK